VTYVGKDIANQFWKFGLLGRDFYYRMFDKRDGKVLWATTSHPGQAQGTPKFGRAAAVYNVIDSRQAYLQDLLKQALEAMGFHEQSARSTHFSYEMVALSHATAKSLGYEDAESSGKPFVEVSGRKGLGEGRRSAGSARRDCRRKWRRAIRISSPRIGRASRSILPRRPSGTS
jgi:arginyl-tRNA synthetase